MSFARFMELALYDERLGYYRKPARRVGYETGTDFFTASTSGPVFGELVAAACTKVLGANDAARATFVEIGNEQPDGVLAGVAHPFAKVETIPIGAPLVLSGLCIVFSNELFDAQPFRRFVFRDGGWRELGVRLRATDQIEEVEVGSAIPDALPPSAAEGYVVDAPLAATALAERIAQQPWAGLFVACDYGKSWRELVSACPAGTARAYHRHRQSNDLLARPTEQDLTCHVCWDWIADRLTSAGFTLPKIESQEAFFIRQAADVIATISTADAARYSQRKQSLQQLLHPAHLGQKFQVLHARRD